MAQLVILGHKTRSKEVIEILEMLGGKNSRYYVCNVPGYAYSIDEQGIIDLYISSSNSSITFTLEEFLEKYPYKVGDKVYNIVHNENQTITSAAWDCKENEVVYQTDNNEYVYVNYLQPYKEETMKKINIEKLLKDCPQGMELDCILFDAKVIYQGLSKRVSTHPIIVQTEHGFEFELTQYGQIYNIVGSNCVIFPKGKTSWEGFHRPFKPGDIVITNSNEHAFIYSGENDKFWECYCGVYCGTRNICINSKHWSDKQHELRLATKKEIEKLFQVITDNGYKWNPETKELEKLIQPKFKVGDWVVNKFGDIWHIDSFNSENYQVSNGDKYCYFLIEEQDKMHLWTINDAKDGDVIFYDSGWTCIFKRIHGIWYSSYCFITDDGEFHTGYNEHAVNATINGNAHPATEEQCKFLFQKIKEAGYKWNVETKTLEKLIELKFKVGDVIVNNYRKHLNGDSRSWKIYQITNDKYIFTDGSFMYIQDQNNWVLNTAKFDITTFKPFDKVLVRCSTLEKWRIQLFEKYDKTYQDPFICIGCNKYRQCIPYEGNKHLLDTADDCDEYFKIWK